MGNNSSTTNAASSAIPGSSSPVARSELSLPDAASDTTSPETKSTHTAPLSDEYGHTFIHRLSQNQLAICLTVWKPSAVSLRNKKNVPCSFQWKMIYPCRESRNGWFDDTSFTTDGQSTPLVKNLQSASKAFNAEIGTKWREYAWDKMAEEWTNEVIEIVSQKPDRPSHKQEYYVVSEEGFELFRQFYSRCHTNNVPDSDTSFECSFEGSFSPVTQRFRRLKEWPKAILESTLKTSAEARPSTAWINAACNGNIDDAFDDNCITVYQDPRGANIVMGGCTVRTPQPTRRIRRENTYKVDSSASMYSGTTVPTHTHVTSESTPAAIEPTHASVQPKEAEIDLIDFLERGEQVPPQIHIDAIMATLNRLERTSGLPDGLSKPAKLLKDDIMSYIDSSSRTCPCCGACHPQA